MKKLLTLMLLWGSMAAGVAAGQGTENRYRFALNLKQVQNDRLSVSLQPPAITRPEIIYNLPKIVPGTYSVYDFGKFVSDFKALDKKGKPLPVERLDQNRWKIQQAQQLAIITYVVDDTWDTPKKEDHVFEPAGTSIEENQFFLLNTHGFFGYFDEMKRVPYELTITKPQGFYGSTPLKTSRSTDSTDTYEIASYMELADSPLMYNRPDTTVLRLGDSDVLVSVFEPSGRIKSADIAGNIKATLEAQRNYLGGKLPVDKYAFLIYLVPDPLPGGYGALEHSYSSVYYLPVQQPEELSELIRSTAAHEFFHIVTPLTIHAIQIHDFDFINPQMSEHLWLYEGVTEYFASHVQAYEKLMPPQEYLEKLREYIMVSRSYFNDTLPFTTMSRGCLHEHKNQYQNVYNKGALIGLALDLKLRELSDGKYGLRNLMHDLSGRYGKEKAFKDEELFGQIAAITYPEIEGFLKRYVAGTEPLPLEELFNKVGVDYAREKKEQKITMGQVALGKNPMTNAVYIANTDHMNDFGKKMGYRTNDKLLSINGEKVTAENFEALSAKHIKNAKPGQKIKIMVERQDKSGSRSVALKGKLEAVEAKSPYYLAFTPNPTSQQKKLREAWLNQAVN